MKENVAVILNFNDKQLTSDWAKKLSLYNSIDAVVIVDNCSTDQSYEFLKKIENDKIVVIKSDINKGYAAGNNIGAKYAVENLKAKKILISNPDIICDESSIKKILNLLDEKDIGIATGIVHNRNTDGSFKIFSSFGWKIPTYKDLIINTFLVSYKIARKTGHSIYYDYGILNKNRYVQVEAVSGCFFGIRADVLKNIDYFDERTFLYFEETILGYSLKKERYRVVIDTQANVYHCEKVDKWVSLKKRIRTCQITLNSIDVYLNEYLKVSYIKNRIYHILFWSGKVETYVLCKIFKK